MPLDRQIIHAVAEYYHRDLNYSSYLQKFDFIDDEALRTRLAQEYYIARYAAKLQEALDFDENSFELLGHLKLQIIQYAGIYEAILSYLLQNEFVTHQSVTQLGRKTVYKKVDALANGTTIQHQGEELFLCRSADLRDKWVYIRFEDKLRVAKHIGFLKDSVSEIILETYQIRHSVHIEKAVADEIVFEMEQCKQAYFAINDFTNGIKEFLANQGTATSVDTSIESEIDTDELRGNE